MAEYVNQHVTTFQSTQSYAERMNMRASSCVKSKIQNVAVTTPKISLLKSATGAAVFTVKKLVNILLLPLETCAIALSEKGGTPITLSLGQAMVVCGATSTIDNVRLTEGSCIAVEMSLRECNAIQPTRKSGILWSDVSVFSASQQLSVVSNLASRYLCNGIATSISVISAIATMSFVEVILSLSDQQSTKPFNLTDQNVSDIESYIDANLEESICLQQLAGICGMSVSKFAKAFKAKTGTSPYKFVLSRRLSLACDLLTTSERSLGDIAYEAGFSSQSHMTEFFRRNLSTTPGKYRTMNFMDTQIAPLRRCA